VTAGLRHCSAASLNQPPTFGKVSGMEAGMGANAADCVVVCALSMCQFYMLKQFDYIENSYFLNF